MTKITDIPAIRFKGFSDTWEQRKLGDVVDVRSGKDYKHLSEGNIPVYGTGGFMLSVNQALSYDEDAIGIGRKGTIDKPYILKAPFWTVDTLFYAIPREKVDLNFAFDVFQNIDWKKKDESTGVPSLSKTAINEIDVLVPQYDEQQPLGQFFNRIDNLITLHQRKYDKLTNVKKSMLEKMFPQNGSNVPEIRFKGFTEAWEQRKVREVTDRYDNLRIPVAASLRVAGTTPYYGANGIQDYVDGYTHDGEFILVAEDGANDLKNYPVKCVKGRIWVNNHAHVLQGKYDCADNQFLAYAISQADIESLLVGGGRAKLNAETLMGIDLLLPNKAEQIRIGKYLAQLDNLITLHQRELEKLKNLKKACLEKMFV
jgi:type I restriction enzyme S subunit